MNVGKVAIDAKDPCDLIQQVRSLLSANGIFIKELVIDVRIVHEMLNSERFFQCIELSHDLDKKDKVCGIPYTAERL